MISRRQFLGLIGASAIFPSGLLAQTRYPIADTHSHFGLIERNLPWSDLPQQAQEANLRLLALKIVSDSEWLRVTPRGIAQHGFPAPGQAERAFYSTLEKIKSYLAAKNISYVQSAQEIDDVAQAGLQVVLSAEGADFLEGKIEQLPKAYAAGVRHLQLSHYMNSYLGDLQTSPPKHGGLSPFGAQVIQECNRLGILVDIAHSDMHTVDGALEVSSRPLLWSHGWVSQGEGSHTDSWGMLARRLSLKYAKKIADQGGVVGLWSLGIDAKYLASQPDYPIVLGKPKSLKSYASGLANMAKELGADHVCIGTDLEGVGPYGVIDHYRDLQVVAGKLSDIGLSDQEIGKICYGNYARVLKQALA